MNETINETEETTRLIDYIRKHGPIKTARVSSAQARGAAKAYAYWGAVRYEVRVSYNGYPTNVALGRASSDRRSERLAEQDLDDMCEVEDRIHLQTIGRLTKYDIHELLERLSFQPQN